MRTLATLGLVVLVGACGSSGAVEGPVTLGRWTFTLPTGARAEVDTTDAQPDWMRGRLGSFRAIVATGDVYTVRVHERVQRAVPNTEAVARWVGCHTLDASADCETRVVRREDGLSAVTARAALVTPDDLVIVADASGNCVQLSVACAGACRNASDFVFMLARGANATHMPRDPVGPLDLPIGDHRVHVVLTPGLVVTSAAFDEIGYAITTVHAPGEHPPRIELVQEEDAGASLPAGARSSIVLAGTPHDAVERADLLDGSPYTLSYLGFDGAPPISVMVYPASGPGRDTVLAALAAAP